MTTRNPGDIVVATADELKEMLRIRNILIDTIELNAIHPTYVIPAMISIITFICKKNNINENEAIKIFKSNFREFYPVV